MFSSSTYFHRSPTAFINIALILTVVVSISCTSLFEGSKTSSSNNNNATPISIGPRLVPGSGFSGTTEEPGQIGIGNAKAIARWDMVPYQTIQTDTFNVGIVAFHIAGIDRVEISLEGGPFTAVNTMALNTQTGVVEYFATIKRSDFSQDGAIELRAIAYPKLERPQAEGTGNYLGGGFARVLEPLHLYLDAGELQVRPIKYVDAKLGSDTTGNGTTSLPYRTPWKAAVAAAADGGLDSGEGATIYLAEGDYKWEKTTGDASPKTIFRWMTFSAWPGANRDRVRITDSSYPGMDIRFLHIKNISMHAAINRGVNFDGEGDYLWLDNFKHFGAGPAVWTPGAHIAYGFSEIYMTDCEGVNGLGALPGSPRLVRNSHYTNVTYGPAAPKIVINSSWTNLQDFGTSWHPDFIHWNGGGPSTVHDNSIVYGARCTNCNSEGIFFKNSGRLNNTALVNISYSSSSTGNIPSDFGHSSVAVDHFLIWNISFDSSFMIQLPQAAMSNISFRGNFLANINIDRNTPPYGDFFDPLWFDSNHYGTHNNPSMITPGTNKSTGDPRFVNPANDENADFHLLDDSPLKHRMIPVTPMDIDNRPRNTNTASVGAYE